MSHVIIQNQGELPEHGIRLLGYSNKDEAKIGRFGTGLKEAIALLARSDLFPVIYSGETRYDFCIMNDPAEIHYQINGEEWKGLGIHPDFGKHDWNDFWMVFREVICNSIDEGGLYHDITSDDPSGVAGSTRFYIPVNPKIISAYSKVHERLVMLEEPEKAVESEGSIAYVKREEMKLQVYHKGVWVQADKVSEFSLWDWEFKTLKLNEARSADWSDIERELTSGLVHATSAMVTDLLLVEDKEKHPYEFKCLGRVHWYISSSNGQEWREAFIGLHGKEGILCRTNQEIERVLAAKKKAVVVKHEGLATALQASGVRVPSKALAFEESNFNEVLRPNTTSQELFDVIWDRIGTGDKPEFRIFEDPTGPLGQYSNNVCYVNRNIVGSREERLAMVEEIVHHTSKKADYTREFQTALVDNIVKVIDNG